MNIVYDVAIVGGGPIGLSAAFELVLRGKRVIVFEQSSIVNDWGSSAGFGRQWRVPYAELWLAKLAVQASSAWNDLMSHTGKSKLLDRTGVLWFGDPNVTTPEGNIAQAKKNMDILKQDYTYFPEGHEEDIMKRFPWLSSGLKNNKAVALFVSDGGTIDIKETIKGIANQLYASRRAIIKENSKVTKIVHSKDGVIITVSSSDTTPPSIETYSAEKVILTPGVYVNEVLDNLVSSTGALFPFHLSFIIYMWTSAHYKLSILDPSQITSVSGRLPRPSTDNLPVWIYFGPKPSFDSDPSSPRNYNSFYGFPSDIRDSPFDMRICPAFTSKPDYDFIDYPPSLENRKTDPDAIRFTSEFIKTWMTGWADSTTERKLATCVAGFAIRVDGESDPGQGFVLDILPNTNDKVVLCTGGWGMKFVPLFGRILADLALNGKAQDYEISEMRWDRGITKPRGESRSIHRPKESPQYNYNKWLHFLQLNEGSRDYSKKI